MLDSESRTGVFRVLEEALCNVLHHAKASRVKLTLCRRRERLFMEVRDDGRGIPRKQIHADNSFGIAAMRERIVALGGRLMVMRDPDAGTRVRVWVPVPQGSGKTK